MKYFAGSESSSYQRLYRYTTDVVLLTKKTFNLDTKPSEGYLSILNELLPTEKQILMTAF